MRIPQLSVRFLLVLAILQFVLLGWVLCYYAFHQDEVIAGLEVHPAEPYSSLVLSEHEVLDAVNFLSGPESAGIDLITRARSNLSFGKGQMIWGLLSRPTSSSRGKSPRRGTEYSETEWSARMPKSSRDGVVNFLYDVGLSADLAYSNWNGMAVRELQASPLLPWQKYLDFVVLSSFSKSSVEGLPFIINTNPSMLFIVPPASSEQLGWIDFRQGKSNVWQLEEGLHRLLPRLWALVLKTPEECFEPYELDLLLERGDGGIILLVGSAYNAPDVHLQMAEKAMGRPPVLYAGATGWTDDVNMIEFEDRFLRINQMYPDLHWQPNMTGMTVSAYLEAWLGERYHSARLGSRLRCE
ncbi:hypothetical protein IJT17_07515 [bacterium]|nr:hypothetical protein [bacterium]